MQVAAASERTRLIDADEAAHADRLDRVTHKRVVVGAFILAVICSFLAFTLLFIWSDGLKGQLQSQLRARHRSAQSSHHAHASRDNSDMPPSR
eukprot:CAMPEP_0202814628 /NCGR_PEP_ID=MMETSP1389-20130828/5711_1 /ASSEMBLY_ACC=CAM_ASM_000865 /TAXON_ID=302021 /ORGANISM="Rhodomonas sp., Strain CCMP768" /LENGTH=92 /DNA_ID=CAMNT_0049486435 /DNA_START=48 /DNA_END=326 /DNA_ORIENTATION=-